MVKLKKGDLYLVTGGDYLNGEVVKLTNNDGSEMPEFTSVETGISRFIYTKNVQRLKKLNKKNARRNSSRYNSELLNQLKHDKDVYLLDTGKKGYPEHGETPNCFEMFVDGKLVGTQYIWKSEIGKGKKKSEEVEDMTKKIVGRKYVMTTSEHSTFNEGDKLELVYDDGSSVPQFKRLSDGKERWVMMDKVRLLKKKKKGIKVGDTVRALPSSNGVYSITNQRQGYEGVVVDEDPRHDGKYIRVQKGSGNAHTVLKEHFEKVKSGKKDKKEKKTKIRVGNKIKLAKKDGTTRRYGYVGSMLDIGDIITVDEIAFTHDGEAKIRHEYHTYALSDFELVVEDEVLVKETKDALEKEMYRLQQLSVPKFRVIDGRGHCFSIGEILVLADGRNLGSGSKNFKRLERHDGTTQFLQDTQVELVK